MAYGRSRSGGSTKAKQIKTCNTCGKGELAWAQVAGQWKLFPGHYVNGQWEPDQSQPAHECRKQQQGSSGGAPVVDKGQLTPLTCGCRVTVYITEVDLMKVGYPVCPTCEGYFQIAGAQEEGIKRGYWEP